MNYSDMSMHELFRIEAENQSALLTQGLLNIEGEPNNSGLLEKLMRAAHSIKGAARIVEIEELVAIAHLMEDCFVQAQRDELKIDSNSVDVLLKAVDAIVFVSKQNEDEVDEVISKHGSEYQQLIYSLHAILDGDPGSSSYPGEKTKIATLEIENNVVEHSKQTFNSNGIEISASGKENKKETITRKTAERVVRVDSERMNRLLALTGELTVESHWPGPYSRSLSTLKRDYSELSNIIDELRESLAERNVILDADSLLFSSAQSKLSECRSSLNDKLLELENYDLRNSSLTTRIFNEVVASRMRPFSDATQGLHRNVRDLSRRLGKNVTLEITGQNVLIDRDVIDSIKSPLVHLIRNAVDHGVETPEERQQSGKNSTAVIRLKASHGGGLLVISIADDGRGIDLDVLREKIISHKLAGRDIVENLSEPELLSFLYLPDFTTRETVTEISGRGVGLDVVHDLVSDLHGSIWAENVTGEGLKFVLQLPVTLSVMSSIVVVVAGEKYAFPLSRVDRLESVSANDLTELNGLKYIEIDGKKIPLVSAAKLLGLNINQENVESLNVVIISNRNNTFGIVIDEYIGRSDLSVQSLDKLLGKVQDISAAAITRDGEAVLIFDVDDLLHTTQNYFEEELHEGKVLNDKPESQIQCKRILVVDDSLTVREVERKLLTDAGYQVDVAVDGVDSWNALRRAKYDLLITDVDMPRMDGIKLVRLVKNDKQLCRLPVMIISYKDRQEDRQRGLEAGADYYLTKGSFLDDVLLEAVVDLIGEVSVA